MNDDIIRIIISTDNHLGYLNKDPVRCDDCFASFEEVLIAAKEKQADFVLFAGDLFHENKPSRKTVVSTIDLLRKYCTGDSPVYLEILNDQAEVFKNTSLKKVNYEDPFYAISLPIFAIHGNHDDPSREGVGTSLAALDILSASNLINYIGKSEQVDDIEITPLLLRKGKTMIALYALGAVRDERLNRMWSQKNVKFIRPKEDQGREKFLNIFVLHQNRDYGRGLKNCVHESMIPDWMDIVIWGNEHECVPNLVESLVGTFRIYQPGSSVATSLCEGESSKYPKHYGLLEVNREKFRLNTFPYTQIRSFTYQDISLLNEGLDPREPHVEDSINLFLTKKVKELIHEARQNLQDSRSANLSISSTSLQEQPKYEIREPQKVLVKLRVDHSSFPTINQQRFGTQFLGEVANPSDVILLTRKRREYERMLPSGEKMKFDALKISGDTEALSRVRVEDLVSEALEHSNKQLGILTPEQLSTALEEFVLKKISSAIFDTTEHALTATQAYLNSDRDIFELCTDKEAILKSAQQFREECIHTGKSIIKPKSNNVLRSTKIEQISDDEENNMELQHDNDNDDNNNDDDNNEQNTTTKTKGKGRGRAGTSKTSSSRSTKKTTTTTTTSPSKASTKSKTTTRGGRGTTKSKSRVIDDDDEDDEEEFIEHSDDDNYEEKGQNLSDELEEFSSDESLNNFIVPDGSDSDSGNKKKGKKTTKTTTAPTTSTKVPPKPVSNPKTSRSTNSTTTKVISTPKENTRTTKSNLSQKSTVATSSNLTSGPRILASGRSQKKSQDIQLSMSSVDIDLSGNDHGNYGGDTYDNDNNDTNDYQSKGKRNRSGASIPPSSSGLTGGIAIDLTGDDIWSSNAKNIPNVSKSQTTRKPPTQLKW